MGERLRRDVSDTAVVEPGDPFESVEALVNFLVDAGYADRDRHGKVDVTDGGIAYLLCRIAVDLRSLSSISSSH